MKGSFQPTRPGFSASNAGLRASSQAVRRSADRGTTTSRHLSQTARVAAIQREEYGPIGLELSKDADMVQWLQQQLAAQQGPLSAAAPAASRTCSRGWNVEPLAVSTPPQKAAIATATASSPRHTCKVAAVAESQDSANGAACNWRLEGNNCLSMHAITMHGACLSQYDGLRSEMLSDGLQLDCREAQNLRAILY